MKIGDSGLGAGEPAKQAGTGDPGPGTGEAGTSNADDEKATGSSGRAKLKRLRWRCRRGTRELDALLGGWLASHVSMDDAQFAAFDSLLDRQDPELWDWLMGHAESPRDDWQAIIAEIRRYAGLAA